ncbi:MAG: Transcriptional regulatory protein ZraR [Lentisphaerae bacterium ADurb.BinA184]|nr:MAG: Transcriptional regulatory protein ZraR [Lentisphaerae bacterium ADurb.BinA184]
MQELRVQLWNNVFTHDFLTYERLLWNRLEDFSTLLLGETGTGKGTAAAAIGRSGYIPFDARGGRFAQSFTEIFIAANLSQFAESLIESELFGHRKGAFTGAVETHEGVFGRCLPNGAIFLDEIGEVSVPVQIKLLRVIHERVFSPVGSHEGRRFAGRVIAATNRPLETLRASGRFRDDFYYRLCSDQIVVPPLRQRLGEDAGELGLLVGHILRRLCGKDGVPKTGEVVGCLEAQVGAGYAWPGNVRELEQAVRRILLKGRYDGQAESGAPPGAVPGLAGEIEAGRLDARALVARYCQLLYERSGNYGEVARRTGLDRRTVRKYVLG